MRAAGLHEPHVSITSNRKKVGLPENRDIAHLSNFDVGAISGKPEYSLQFGPILYYLSGVDLATHADLEDVSFFRGAEVNPVDYASARPK